MIRKEVSDKKYREGEGGKQIKRRKARGDDK
jgi:hypothetical protein